MNRLKTVVKEHALNEDAMLNRIRSGRATLKGEDKFMPMKRLLPLGLAAALVITIISSWSFFTPGVTAPVTTGTAAEKPAATPYAMIAIDINPSFEIYTDEDGIVEKIIAKNEDAQQYEADEDFADLVGEPVEKVTEKIIRWAEKKGFIVTSEENEAYVLISAVILNANGDHKPDTLEESETYSEQEKAEIEKAQENFGLKINEAISDLEDDDIKVAVIKATLRDVKFADKAKIPLGLSIVKGMVDLDGDGSLDSDDDINDDGNPDKISDVMKYLKEQVEGNENISTELAAMFAKRISILESKAERDALKESKTSDPEDSEADDSPKGKPSMPPGQEKKSGTDAVTSGA